MHTSAVILLRDHHLSLKWLLIWRDTPKKHFFCSITLQTTSYYEGWFSPILTFKFCYAILLCCYSVFLGILICMFESYYSLSNFAICFTDFIMPLCILLFSFEFCYLLFTFPILLCQYQFCYSVSNSIIRFRIMFLQIRDFHSLFGRQCPGDQ